MAKNRLKIQIITNREINEHIEKLIYKSIALRIYNSGVLKYGTGTVGDVKK